MQKFKYPSRDRTQLTLSKESLQHDFVPLSIQIDTTATYRLAKDISVDKYAPRKNKRNTRANTSGTETA